MKNKPFVIKKDTFRFWLVNLLLRISNFKFSGVSLGWRSWIKCNLSVGYGTGIGWGFVARGFGRVSIGRYCAFGENVRVISSNHDMSSPFISFILQDYVFNRRLIAEKKDVYIGNDVWVGDSVIILPGVNIGNGCVIAAGSVVTKDILDFEVVGGVPARVIRKRFNSSTIEEFTKVGWWNMSLPEIKDLSEEISKL